MATEGMGLKNRCKRVGGEIRIEWAYWAFNKV